MRRREAAASGRPTASARSSQAAWTSHFSVSLCLCGHVTTIAASVKESLS